MLPLDIVSSSREITDAAELERMFDGLQEAGIDGVMVDVWWGLTELSPKVYDFKVYDQLFELARARGWRVEVMASFHQCGGNVGDACDIPLPRFVVEEEGIWYEDAAGVQNREYVSLFADDERLSDGRTPLDMYKDWLEAFASHYSADLGGLISEIMVGMGPAGELRYPAYPSDRWSFCGVGEFQAYGRLAHKSLLSAAEAASKPAWGAPPNRSSLGNYNSTPDETEFFTTGFSSDAGRFFLDWYSGALKLHGHRVLALARSAVGGRTKVSGKVAGIHWWYDTPSHAAELTAGYYNTNGRDAYGELGQIFAKEDATLDFTCLEMRNTEQREECHSRPEEMVMQVAMATGSAGVEFSGENALLRYDRTAFAQVRSYKAHLGSFTYLRLRADLLEPQSLARFAEFVSSLHSGSADAALAPADLEANSLGEQAAQPPALRL